MASKNYYIKKGYIPNLIQATYDAEGNEGFWNENRIRNSAHLQYYVYETCRRLIKRKKFVNVMDVGCGPPVKIKHLFDLTHTKITLVDQPSVKNIVKTIIPNARFIETNLERIDINLNEEFDLIICCDVIEHLLDPDICVDFIKSHLQTNGLAVFSTPERDNRRGIECNECTKKEHVREWNKKEFSMYLENRGFRIESHQLFPQSRMNVIKYILSRAVKNVINHPKWYSCQMTVCSL
jgi:SAM-dependent methyltransferase